MLVDSANVAIPPVSWAGDGLLGLEFFQSPCHPCLRRRDHRITAHFCTYCVVPAIGLPKGKSTNPNRFLESIQRAKLDSKFTKVAADGCSPCQPSLSCKESQPHISAGGVMAAQNEAMMERSRDRGCQIRWSLRLCGHCQCRCP